MSFFRGDQQDPTDEAQSQDGDQPPQANDLRRRFHRPRQQPADQNVAPQNPAPIQPPVNLAPNQAAQGNNQAPILPILPVLPVQGGPPQPQGNRAAQLGLRPNTRQGNAPNVQGWNPPANNVPVQNVPVQNVPVQNAPVQPVVQQPPPIDPNAVNAKTLNQVDTIQQKHRRWTTNAMTLLGLRSHIAQDRVLGSAIATTARIDETFCRVGDPDDAATLRGNFQPAQLNGDPALSGMLNQLAAFEAHAPGNGVLPRGQQQTDPLRQSAQLLEQSLVNNAHPAKQAALQAVKAKLRPYDLRDQIVAFGNPPWPPQQAAQAAKAKVELDLLSLPPNARIAELNGTGGVNASWWINRSGGAGDQKSFLCKPPATQSDIDGVPAGGEVAREALVQRAADVFAAKLGVDLKFPETHSLALDSSFFPPNTYPPNTKVACSVQEARPNQGGAKARTKAELNRVPAEQVHALAILDIATLNVDRHGDNVMLSGTDLVPIDHGGNLPDPTNAPRALARVENAMGSGHNALLTIPSAHAPLSKEMLAALKELKPSAIATHLKTERDRINTETGTADPNLADPSMLSDAAIDTSARAMEFMKFAAGKYPDISPAVLQTALASKAKTLLAPALDAKQFKVVAERALNEARANAPVLKEACMLNKVEKTLVRERLVAAGWPLGNQGAPSPTIANNQALALQIVASGIAYTDPIPPVGANLPRLAPPVPAGSAPKQSQIDDMAKEYAILKNQSFVTNRQIRMDEEWAAFQALKTIRQKTPDLFEEVASFALVAQAAWRTPTIILRAIGQMQTIRRQLAQAAAQAGDPVTAIQANLLALKVTAVNRIIGLINGPLNAQMTQALQVAQNGNNVMAQVSRTSDAVYELVRTNLRAEVDDLRNQNHVTPAQAKQMHADINDGSIEGVTQDIIGHKTPLALPRRVFV